VLDQLARLLLTQPSQGKKASEGKADPSRLEFRAKRNDQQYGQIRQRVYHLVQQLKRAGISPMYILEQDEN
jgi:hypothetical protein